MPTKKHINVVKVYLPREEKQSDIPQVFRRIPRLYLELLENKSKIKQDLVNREHIPSSSVPVLQETLRTSHELENYKQTRGSINKDTEDYRPPDQVHNKPIEIIDSESDNASLHSGDEIKENADNSIDRVDNHNRNDRNKKDNDRNERDNERDNERGNDRNERDNERGNDRNERDNERDNERGNDRNERDDERGNDRNERDDERGNDRNERDDDRNGRNGRNERDNERDDDINGRNERYDDRNERDDDRNERYDDRNGRHNRYIDIDDNESVRSKNSENDLSDRLKELLNDTDNEGDSIKDKKRSIELSRGDTYNNKYSRYRERSFNHKSSHRSTPYRSLHRDVNMIGEPTPYRSLHRDVNMIGEPPTLAELQERGAYQANENLRDINQVNLGDQDLEDRKRELLFKFDLLRKSYPNGTVPEFSIHSDLDAMSKSYADSIHRLSLDSSVENYKTYLIGGFMLVEFIFGNFLKFDMQGFTQQQILSMNSYEKLLIELGEKSYVPNGSKWPVELRLLFLIIMNAAFFIVSKIIMKKTGANLMNMINGVNTSSTSSAPSRKRKMRGPKINLDDIPE